MSEDSSSSPSSEETATPAAETHRGKKNAKKVTMKGESEEDRLRAAGQRRP